ncbi:MAG: hypothetical protein LCH73_15770 [Proteobacteria bacterium]|nr:hypothetical protein [Pseudomonadota bacterium]
MATDQPAWRRIAMRDAFQWLSYLQYPAMLVALGYVCKSMLAMPALRQTGWAPLFDDWNYAMLYMGVGVGLSSLQDPTKTQNELSRRVWQDPRKGRWMLVVLAAYALGTMALGLVGAYLADSTALNQLSLGLVAFGLGMVGLLKTAIDMREHHRLDRQRQ